MSVLLESDALRVSVSPEVGGTISMIRHKQLGLSVLGQVPWMPVAAPLQPPAAPDEATWLTRYGGGWPLLFPNGGDACTFQGRFHGFHGEASISAWEYTATAGSIRLERRFDVLPLRMRREISLVGDRLTIRETATVEGSEPVAVMWGHHPTFGSDLLAGDFEIATGARSVRVDQGYDPPANPLLPGASGPWPLVPGKTGTVDLSRPAANGVGAALAFLGDFAAPWVAIRRSDNAIAAVLSWDAAIFPYAWFWCEFGGTTDAPWHGEGRLLGIEPNATCAGAGIADAHQRGERLIVLQPGEPVTATISLRVFKPSGPITAADMI
jgi:hypothetical protein